MSIFLAGLAASAAACRRDPPPPERPGDLPVLFSGCAAVTRDGCELGTDRTLHVVAGPGATIGSLHAGDAFADGKAGTIATPPAARSLVVEGTAGGRPARFTLPLRDAAPLPWLDEAKALRGKDPARAKALAEQHASDADPVARALARGLLARLTLGAGNPEAAFPIFREAIALDREAGRLSDAVDDSFALAFALHQRSHRYDEARGALDAVLGDLPRYPEGRAREPYYRGILASETGDRRGALALLREAEKRAHELVMSRLERNARSALALEMQMIGRARESIAILRELGAAPGATPCERMENANNVGWGAILAGAPGEAREALERAIATEGCADAYPRSFALANLARLAIDQGDATAAEAHLAAARAAVKEPRGTERLAWLDLEGRILLARRKPAEAIARFDEERTLARAAVLLEPEWSALVGRAEALEAIAKDGEAIAALLEAEALVDRAMLLVPLGEGRGAFVADRSRSARGAVELLVRKGRAAEAARVAKHARARVLASLERALVLERLSPAERAKWEAAVRAYRSAREALDAAAAADWKLAADALAKATEERRERERAIQTALEGALARTGSAGAPPAPDEPLSDGDLELVVHPGKKGWIAIAVDASGATANAVPAPSDPAIASALFDPIAARLDRAKRVRVRAYGAFRRVDVHALPFRGAPLVDRLVVDYPVGLGAPSARARPTEAASRSVVVGDPTSDLPGALAEAKAVARALEGRGPVKALYQTEATGAAVTSALRGASLLHYAGHGVFAGWESALPLAESSHLGVGDVLALAPAPAEVVLSGCEAARDDDEAEGLGIAQAFVAAGAEEVVAPTRRVDDALSSKLTSRLEERRAPTSLASALAAAQRASLASRGAGDAGDAGDWAAFRVLAR